MEEQINSGCFNLRTVDEPINFGEGFTKLKLSSEQRADMSMFLQQVPSLAAADSLANAYVATFPDGVTHDLVKLKNGGYFSMWRTENGTFGGAVPLQKMTAQAAVLGAVSTMALVSGQYFMTQINNKLRVMEMSLDKILEFLYGDKKAELMSEMSIVKFAYENYSSIMRYEAQRMATLTSLQNARAVAMKDIEFYISDLTSTVYSKDESDVITLAEKAFQIKESLELSIQLYCASNLAEVYYSRNYDETFLNYIEDDLTTYIDKCEKRILGCFSALNTRLDAFKGHLLKKVDKSAQVERIEQELAKLNSAEKSPVRISVETSMEAARRNPEFYITSSGELYMKD